MVPYAVIDDTQREDFPETESLAESLAAISVFAGVPKLENFWLSPTPSWTICARVYLVLGIGQGIAFQIIWRETSS
jgi:hypothetical protein